MVIDGKPYEVRMGVKRRFRIYGEFHEVYPDPEERGIRIDGVILYKFGEPKKDVKIGHRVVEMFYHGPVRKFWVDGQQHKLRLDAPPFNMTFDGTVYGFQIDGRDNMLLVDRLEKGPFGGPPRPLVLNNVEHEICFEMQRRILIDNQSCELKLDRDIPVIMYNGKPHGIRFEGGPRNMFIDDVPYSVPMDKAVKVTLPTRTGLRTHYLAFGGPAHEVIIDGKWFEVKFNNVPKNITIGNRVISIRLEPPVPRVKILSEITHGFEENPKQPGPFPHMPQPPLPPTLAPRGPQPAGLGPEGAAAAAKPAQDEFPKPEGPQPATTAPDAAVTAAPAMSVETSIAMTNPAMTAAQPGMGMQPSVVRMQGNMAPGPMPGMMRGPTQNLVNNPMANPLANPMLMGMMQGLNVMQMPTSGPQQMFPGLPGALINLQNIQRMMGQSE
nr:hypothetical protein BaRGS_022029 [Batillaria attramentaria]